MRASDYQSVIFAFTLRLFVVTAVCQMEFTVRTKKIMLEGYLSSSILMFFTCMALKIKKSWVLLAKT